MNCAAIPEHLLENEMFGHVKGGYTGALTGSRGAFQMADGGTLFLDEVAEMPLPLQPKLLRALAEGEVKRVGGEDLEKVDVRLVSATNKDFQDDVETARFRGDLYYRLGLARIRLPPLRERREDLPLLARHFADGHRVTTGHWTRWRPTTGRATCGS